MSARDEHSASPSRMRPLLRALRAAPLLLGATLAAAAGAAAQLPVSGTLGGGVGVEAYYFSDHAATGIRNIVLVTVPFAARAQLPARLALEVAGAYAHGGVALDGDDGRATLSGLTDTSLRLSRTFGRDRLVLALIGQVPTGHTRHTEEEAVVADAVAADLLPFRISNWGAGGGIGFSAAYAVTAGGFGIGVTGGYVLAGEFEPFAEADAPLSYRPGNETTLRVAVDRSMGRSGKAALQATWQGSDDDQIDGTNLYRAGDRLQVVASYQAAVWRGTGLVYGGVLHRENGTSLDPAAPGTPVQDLWLGGAALRFPRGRASVTPSIEGRVFRSEDGEGQGWLGGAGVSVDVPAGPVTLVPSLRGRVGNLVVAEDVETRLTGFEVGLGVRMAVQ